MSNLLTSDDIVKGITSLIIVNPLFAGKKLNVFVIVNECAGSFTQKKKSVKQKAILQSAVERAKAKKPVVESYETKFFLTEYSGHAEVIARKIIDEIVSTEKKSEFNVIVSAGGDGTSLETQTALYKAAEESELLKKVVKENIVVLRLPLGTGCDGTDGHTFDEAIKLLEGPLHFANARAIKVWYDGNPTEEDFARAKKDPKEFDKGKWTAPWYSFNIAGLGVDGYVCHMTDVMRRKIPGDVYSLWVNLSALFYDNAFPAFDANIKIYDANDNLVDERNQKFEMIAFGVSGHRTFGSGKMILPNDDNLSIVRKLSPLELAVKNSTVNDGRYVGTDLGRLYKAKKVVIDYGGPIIAELDGETHLLIKESFPLTMEITEPCIQILESDSLKWDKGTVRNN